MLEFIKEYYQGCTLRDNTDFFHIFLNDGKIREIGVYSKDQNGVKTVLDDNTVQIYYDCLVDVYGTKHDIEFLATVKREKGGLYFTGTLKNHSNAKVNEVQYPYIQFEKTFVDVEDEVLYCPFGLGFRQNNPRADVKKAHSEYLHADYKKIIRTYTYPSKLTMPWLGIQSGNKFLHFQREDELGEICGINLAADPRNSETENDLTVFVTSYPILHSGEELELAPVFCAVFDGDWTKGADCYREWMLKSDWYKPVVPAESARCMNGFQRIIMKHQYGEIYLKYNDLVDVFEKGRKHGIDHILLFGWWKGCFDNGYPKYEPDPEMGGEQELKKAIAEITRRGGYVYLYSNGKLIDTTSDFFKEHGLESCVTDMDGNLNYEKYPFGDDGTLLRNYPYKTFTTACFGSEVWQEKLLDTAKIKLDFNPSGIFFDQLGGHWGRMPLCFNVNHKHKTRAASDSPYRIEAINKIRVMMPEGKSLGTEYFVDRYAILFDYIHGCNFGCQMTAGAYPYIVRYLFPHVIISNRWTHDERAGYKDELNYSFLYNLIFDVSVYRGRRGSMDSQINYSNHIKKLIDLKNQYKDYFNLGLFGYESDLENLPAGVLGACYTLGEDRLYVFMNKTDNDVEFSYNGVTVSIPAHDVSCKE